MRILFLSRWFPYPPDNGSKIRIWNLIRYLASRHEVDLISFTSEPLSEGRLEVARRTCQHVDCAFYRPFQPTRLKALAGFFALRPRAIIDTFSADMQALIEQARSRNAYDLVIASQIDMAPYALTLTDTPKLFEEIELTVLYEDFAQQHDPLQKLRKGLTWQKMSRYVASILNHFDGSTVVSEQERELVSQVSSGYSPVHIVPNGIDPTFYCADYRTPPTDSLVYSGALTYSANYDAIDFFLKKVFPLIQTSRPSVKLSITGKLDDVSVRHLPHYEGIILTGYLDDVRPTIAQSWASVVPLRIGGGTRFKILESLALGTPVVTTSKGVEGLDLIPGQDILVADEPSDFAAAVVRLLESQELRDTLGHNGRRAVTAKYDWRTIGESFCEFAEATARRGHRTP